MIRERRARRLDSKGGEEGDRDRDGESRTQDRAERQKRERGIQTKEEGEEWGEGEGE